MIYDARREKIVGNYSGETVIEIVVGSLVYLIIKVTGYSLFAKYLNKVFGRNNNIWKIGFIRTALGIVLGTIINFALFTNLDIASGRSPIGGEDTWLYFVSLIVLRIFEWGLVIFWFYSDKKMVMNVSIIKALLLGILCSFALDIPIMLGLIAVIATIC